MLQTSPMNAHSMFFKTETAHANLIRCKRADDRLEFEYTYKKKTDRLLLDPTNEPNISNDSAIRGCLPVAKKI